MYVCRRDFAVHFFVVVACAGDVYAWGMGTNKQLGQAEEDDVLEPVLITGKQLVDK